MDNIKVKKIVNQNKLEKIKKVEKKSKKITNKKI